jgi:hypothetical protein
VTLKPSNNLGPVSESCRPLRNATQPNSEPGRARVGAGHYVLCGTRWASPTCPWFSRLGEHVGPRPTRTMTPLLQRPPDVTRHPHAWTATRIRAYFAQEPEVRPSSKGRTSLPPDTRSPSLGSPTVRAWHYVLRGTRRASPTCPSGPGFSRSGEHPGREPTQGVTRPISIAQERRARSTANPPTARGTLIPGPEPEASLT